MNVLSMEDQRLKYPSWNRGHMRAAAIRAINAPSIAFDATRDFVTSLSAGSALPPRCSGGRGFETGVAVMPLVKGDKDLTDKDWDSIHSTRAGHGDEVKVQQLLLGRIRNTKKLLRTAALIWVQPCAMASSSSARPGWSSVRERRSARERLMTGISDARPRRPRGARLVNGVSIAQVPDKKTAAGCHLIGGAAAPSKRLARRTPWTQSPA